MRRTGILLLVLAWTAAVLVPTQAASAPRPAPRSGIDVYVGTVSAEDVARVIALGVDRHDLQLKKVAGETGEDAELQLEVALSGLQARKLQGDGVDLSLKRIDGQTVAERATERAADGYEVFRRYSGATGLKQELRQVAIDNPDITKLVRFGTTVQGRPIVGLRVTKNATKVEDGRRPAVLYVGAQHAREWITPEMVRRLMHHVVDGYGVDPRLTRMVDRRELWFVPVANPDGYNHTFKDGQRLWRKNLADNNGDGSFDDADGVDLNRNFQTKWGYDNEGSSPDPSSFTYRGPRPASEPETRALNRLNERVGFEFFVNFHSAAALLLYGTGWQVATPTPDDVIYEAMAGDDANPAIEGFDPDISAELYTTNGDTDTHLTEAYGTLGFTPEMSTCAMAAESDPDDEWEVLDCGSGFEFPDDPVLVQEEFERNLPFALSVARSADDPDDPESVVGLEAENFRVDSFDVSYGSPQEVAVTAKRALNNLRMRYRVDGGPKQTTRAPEWAGGERYGDENDDYYAEYRGRVRGADEGESVRVWFTGREPGVGRVSSERFTYDVESDSNADVLVIANEDYTGVDPEYPPGVTAPKYAEQYVATAEDAGYSADVWDVDAQGIPHDLGVLSHYDGVVWYLGDNRLTQDPEDVLTETPFGDLPDMAVAERQQYLTMAVRDYLNEGGKLVHLGETAQHEGLPGFSDFVGGLYYGLNGDPTADCVVSPRPDGSTDGFFEDCLIMADDFSQYYLGGYRRFSVPAADEVTGLRAPFLAFDALFGGPGATPDNPIDEAGAYTPTSDVLPVDEFPQFRSRATLLLPPVPGSPFAPVEGDQYAAAQHADNSYMRLTRTATIPADATSASLDLQMSASVEEDYDHVIVEARPVNTEDWTTLEETGALTSTDPPAECEEGGFLLTLHPFLEHYLGGADCTDPGSTGTWNTFTGDTGGWVDASYDLSDFAGDEVELSISYVTDPFTGVVGVFVDDTRIVVDGTTVDADGFEDATSDWSVPGAPEGSPTNAGDWVIGPDVLPQRTGIRTRDTHLVGFGLEQLSSDEERLDLLGRALDDLLG